MGIVILSVLVLFHGWILELETKEVGCSLSMGKRPLCSFLSIVVPGGL